MFRVKNIESPRSGRPVANQFKVVFDTAVGRVLLFQSYDTPIAMLINCPIHGTAYYIATDEYFSVTTSKYQKILTVDTPCGHVHLFQSYKIPISFIVFTPHGRYFIETSTAYSHKITTYQEQFRKSFLLNFSYFKVNNIGQWIRALNSPTQFEKLIQTQKDCRLER